MKIILKKQMPTILEAGDRNTVTKKKKISFQESNRKNKINRALYQFGDVEVLSDLFLRERLERLHVPVSYTHLRAHETSLPLVWRILLEKT